MILRRMILSAFLILLLLRTLHAAPLEEIGIVGEAEVLAPAVSKVEGAVKGVLTKIKIMVTEGTGDVYVATSSLTELDMQATARVAAQTACELLGLNLSNYNFLIKVESDSIIVGGPSAGAIMTIGMISALTGWKIREDVLMTGTINPDGSIGPVGGIPEKIEAAAQRNVKLFLVPLGQTIVVKYEIVHKRVGPFVFTEVKPVRINLTEYAREKWGIKVVEVADIAEAASIFFNKSFEVHVVEEPKYRELTREVFSEVAHALIDKAKFMEEMVRDRVEKSDMGSEAKKQILSFIEEKASKNLDEAIRLSDVMPYVAASLAFRALVALQYVDNILSYEEQGIDEITDRVLDVLEKASELVEETAIDSEKDAELIMAAKYRLEEAKENFVKANKTASIHGKLYLLAYSEQKAYASIAWLNITERFSEGRELQLSYVRKIASDYLLAARNSWSYAYTLMSESNILLEEVNRAEEAFGKARSAFEKGDYLLSCAFAIEALVESELALNKIHLKSVQRDITDILVEKARERALYVLSIAQNFTVPILASSYMELADYEENYETKLKLYKLSSYYSKLACQLARVRTLKKTTISERKEMNVASGEEAGKGNLGNTTYYPLATPLIVIGVLLVCYIVVRTRLKRESTTITSPQILCVDKG